MDPIERDAYTLSGPKASGRTLCINIGSRKYSKSNYLPVPESFDNNVLKLDNIRVM